MKIVCCTGEEALWASSQTVIKTLKKMGHEVISVGGFRGATVPVFPKKSYPEQYSYTELKMLVGERWKDIDLILQLEPGFWLTGENNTKVPSAVWVSDIHRGGRPFRDMIVEGHFDYVFLSFYYYAPHFWTKEILPWWLPFGIDTERVHDFNITPECDISFVCETGIKKEFISYYKIDDGDVAYGTCISDRAEFSSPYEYQERGELIKRLSKEFDVRIYPKTYDDSYSKLIQKGRISFNRTGQYDTSFRNFELAGCNRFLITNYVPDILSLFPENTICAYHHYYSHKLSHLFDLDYELISFVINSFLSDYEKTKEKAQKAYDFTMKYHSIEYRLNRLLEVVGGNTLISRDDWR